MSVLQLHVQAKTAMLQDCMEHYGSMPHRKLAKKVSIQPWDMFPTVRV